MFDMMTDTGALQKHFSKPNCQLLQGVEWIHIATILNELDFFFLVVFPKIRTVLIFSLWVLFCSFVSSENEIFEIYVPSWWLQQRLIPIMAFSKRLRDYKTHGQAVSKAARTTVAAQLEVPFLWFCWSCGLREWASTENIPISEGTAFFF